MILHEAYSHIHLINMITFYESTWRFYFMVCLLACWRLPPPCCSSGVEPIRIPTIGQCRLSLDVGRCSILVYALEKPFCPFLFADLFHVIFTQVLHTFEARSGRYLSAASSITHVQEEEWLCSGERNTSHGPKKSQ